MKTYRILAIDGAGFCGLVSAIWLRALQEKLDRPLYTYFDLIAGTSSGSLAAHYISAGLNPQSLVNFYLNQSQEIFSARKGWLAPLKSLWQNPLDYPASDGQELEKVLRREFGQLRLGDLHVQPTLILSYDLDSASAVVFNSTEPSSLSTLICQVNGRQSRGRFPCQQCLKRSTSLL